MPWDSPAKNTVEVAISFSRDLPDPGIKPMFPGLAGGFFTTLPLVKPCEFGLSLHAKKKRVK